MMATLYVTEQGARLEKRYHTLEVVKHDVVLMRVPRARVGEVVLVGNVGVTTPAMRALLGDGIGLTLLTQAGKLLGRLRPAEQLNLPLRHKQYERAQDKAFCLEIGRAIVAGKLRNCRTMAQRMVRSHGFDDPGAVERLNQALSKVESADDLETLRGIEGSAARAYFSVYRAALRPAMTFTRRTRRPPRDPVNAMLSLGYSLLTANLIAAAEIVGLDPYDGFFHADKYGRPALALDLVEEFRPIVVDSVVLYLVNKGTIREGDFVEGEGGATFLKRRALRDFFRRYQFRLGTLVYHPLAKRPLSYFKVFEVQMRRLRQVIEGDAAEYVPFVVR